MRLILTLVSVLLLAGCGLKDDLYLPDPAEDETEQESEREANT